MQTTHGGETSMVLQALAVLGLSASLSVYQPYADGFTYQFTMPPQASKVETDGVAVRKETSAC